MSEPKLAVIELPAATIQRLRQQLQQAVQAIEQAQAGYEREIAQHDEARRQGDALQTSLLKAQAGFEEAHAAAASSCRQVIQTREVAAWLLAEWTDPANWGEAIAAAEAKFGMLDWLREKEGAE